jgi:hypothetical protein
MSKIPDDKPDSKDPEDHQPNNGRENKFPRDPDSGMEMFRQRIRREEQQKAKNELDLENIMKQLRDLCRQSAHIAANLRDKWPRE